MNEYETFMSCIGFVKKPLMSHFKPSAFSQELQRLVTGLRRVKDVFVLLLFLFIYFFQGLQAAGSTCVLSLIMLVLFCTINKWRHKKAVFLI